MRPVQDKCRSGEKYPRYKIALETLTLLFAIGAAAAAGFAIHYYNRQWQEMRKQTVIQRNTSITTERAWLALTSGSTRYLPNAQNLRTVTVDMEIRNTGKTSARQVFAQVQVNVVRNGQKVVLEYSPNSAITQVSMVLLANDSFNFVAPLQHTDAHGVMEAITLSPADWQQLLDGKGFIVTYGRLTYIDSFGRWHWHHFCSWTSPSGLEHAANGFTAQNCTAYNEMDQINLDDDQSGSVTPLKDPFLMNGMIFNAGGLPISLAPQPSG